jgi:leader peptidase (prepilin peptidase) / N-methyltransferase
MHIQTAVILGSILFGLCAAFALNKFAALIPARLEHQWALEIEAHALTLNNTFEPADYSYTLLQKVFITGIASLIGCAIFSTYGLSVNGFVIAFFYLSLLLLVAINIKSALLPDVVIFPTLWLGLLYYAYVGVGAEHIYGAVTGYLIPFFIMIVIKSITGKELIGRGDFKLMAMAGAWFGHSGLLLFFTGFVLGLIAWLVIIYFVAKRNQGWTCTGPAHLIGALAATFGTTLF